MEDRFCQECYTKVGKAGRRWSGRKRVQAWLCSGCGRVTLHPLTMDELETKKQNQEGVTLAPKAH